MKDKALIQKYATCMEEIKKRTEVVYSFFKGKSNSLYVQTTVESICLQIRKILELIALASLVANKDAYASIRKKFASDWNAKNIISDIEKVNPNFYPMPFKIKSSSHGGMLAEIEVLKSGWLTKEEFVQLYRRTGGLLHADNPFGAKKDIDNFLKIVPTWMDKIEALLSKHNMQLADSEFQYHVVMHGVKDGNVEVSLFKRMGKA